MRRSIASHCGSVGSSLTVGSGTRESAAKRAHFRRCQMARVNAFDRCDFRFMGSLRDSDGLAGFSGAVGGEDDFVGAQGVGEAGEGHFFSGVQGVEEGLELGLVWVIGNVAGVEHLHGEFAPLRFVEAAELGGMEFIVEEAAFAADEVDVEIVRLKAINHRCHFADASVAELENRDAGGWVFVFGEVAVRRTGGGAGD